MKAGLQANARQMEHILCCTRGTVTESRSATSLRRTARRVQGTSSDVTTFLTSTTVLEAYAVPPEVWYPGASSLSSVNVPYSALTCTQPRDAGHLRNSSKPSQKWYYNSIKGVCLKFEYMGFGGNANNFLTEDHCNSYCTASKCFHNRVLL